MPQGLSAVGLLGGGVIGGGWAARFLLNGVDVKLFDPDPEAPRKVGEVLANARHAWRRLTMAPLPPEGTLSFVSSVEEAARGVDFVQESTPERLDVKRALLGVASTAAPPSTVIASSTSGLLPSELQAEMVRSDRFVVGHPFNPVYLLPLVEVCGGQATSPATISRAADVYRAIGMRPLELAEEIDGFVADRLLEALWREALWLVHDGVATVEQIDDAIRFGAGLRWSFMGTFLTYRIAGGEAGMRHFMAQFGPALSWPWTKLTDVPELTEQLVERIVAQSDAQAAGRSIRELESLRDECLVAVLQGLRSVGFGAGEVVDDYERALFGRRPTAGIEVVEGRPLTMLERRVPTEWVDYNGHTNDSRYVQLSSEAVDAFLRFIGVDEAYLKSGRSYYTVESHVSYLDQSRAGDLMRADLVLLDHDTKRFHVFVPIYRRTEDGGDVLAAAAEHLLLHVDTTVPRASPADPALLDVLASVAAAHAGIPRPELVGRHVGMVRPNRVSPR
jgi:carnitine 3-dehydrogenase / betainyl-CoA thioesterase